MKNTFAVTMTLLLALTLGGSFLGYHNATRKEEPKAEATAGTTGAATENTTTSQQGGVTTPAKDQAANGASSPSGAGGTMPGTAADMGAAGAASTTATTAGAAGGTGSTTNSTDAGTGNNAGTTNNAGTPGVDNTNAAGATGNQPRETAAAANANAPTGDATAGKTKFTATCAGCHGANAEGAVGPNLRPTNAWTGDQFQTALREGRTPEKTLGAVMPHFSTDQLSDGDIANIHAFLKTLQ